jgi:RNA polymerase sigma factor (TIGR02999 family)
MEPSDRIQALLRGAASGDDQSARAAFDAIYAELRRMASAKASQMPHGATLQTTALVHEAYLRILGRNPGGWENTRHFYFTAARAMRDILVEDARRKNARKRGGGQERVPLEDIAATFDRPPDEILALDRALTQLEQEDPEGHRLVLLRFFTGLPVPEVARVLDVSVSTVERKWRFLRSWLADQLEPPAT